VTDRDWEKELAAIDRQLASVSDEALAGKQTPVAPAPVPAAPGRPVAAPGRLQPAAATVVAPTTRRRWQTTVGLLLRVLVGVAAVVAVVLWPYPSGCGLALAEYLAVVALIGLMGLWTSVASWRHRAPLAHVLGLALLTTSGVFAAREVLPRVGYAMPTIEHPATWVCR
jgi:hypothetical protein